MNQSPKSGRPIADPSGARERPSGRNEPAVRVARDDGPADGLEPAGRVVSRSADPGQSSYGGFSGEGARGPGGQTQPPGVQRTDASIGEGIRDRLAALAEVDVGDVCVELSEGEVGLHGSVADQRARDAVEQCVASVLGVRSVDNRLAVRG